MLGSPPVIAEFCRRLDIRGIVDRACPVRDVAIATHGQVIEALVANRLTSPQPLLHVEDWALLAADLKSVDERGRQSWEAKVQARRRAVEDIEGRQNRLVSQLESRDDPEGTLFAMVHERLRVLEGERKVRLDELRELEDANPAGREQAPELLDLLPVLDVDLGAVPAEILRRLFEAFRLEVRYDKAAHRAVGRVTQSDDSLELLASAVDGLAVERGNESAPPRHVPHAVGAPGSV